MLCCPSGKFVSWFKGRLKGIQITDLVLCVNLGFLACFCPPLPTPCNKYLSNSIKLIKVCMEVFLTFHYKKCWIFRSRNNCPHTYDSASTEVCLWPVVCMCVAPQCEFTCCKAAWLVHRSLLLIGWTLCLWPSHCLSLLVSIIVF